MPDDQYPQVEMPLDLKNVASVMTAAGYDTVYKGKWHLSKPVGNEYAPRDLARYGFMRWNPPDAGENQDLDQAGGGNANNDHRFMFDNGDVAAGAEGAIAYLTSRAARDQPFFMVISLVNPHDVLFYPKTYIDAGYSNRWLVGDIDLPTTVAESLDTKPDAQEQFRRIFQINGVLATDQMKRNYLNYYGNLMRLSDNYLVNVLNTLQATGLLDKTLVICTADHGEMGLAHGGLRQKCFNFYEESLRVPYIYSNPVLFPTAQTSSAMISHVDFLPTIASLFHAPPSARANWQGIDYSHLITDSGGVAPQRYTVFTYDDYQCGQPTPPYVDPPNHIVSIREERYKLAEYYDADGNVPSQWEMYDLLNDPLERNNLAFGINHRPPDVQMQFARLRRELEIVQATRLRPMA
jgi:arylsulfatase A-like enzyme